MTRGAGAAGLHPRTPLDAAGTRKNPKIVGQHARGGLREAEPIRRLAEAALKWTAAP